jgi:hypothetical protein
MGRHGPREGGLCSPTWHLISGCGWPVSQNSLPGPCRCLACRATSLLWSGPGFAAARRIRAAAAAVLAGRRREREIAQVCQLVHGAFLHPQALWTTGPTARHAPT